MTKSSYHKAFIAALQKDGKWLVTGSNSEQIQIVKVFGGKKGTAVRVLLERTPSGYYTLNPVTYAFRSTVSHFDYAMEEERWIRNKNVFKSLVDTLKRVKMWDGIENKDLIQINPKNKKVDKISSKISWFSFTTLFIL